jgi:hypothetical protein
MLSNENLNKPDSCILDKTREVMRNGIVKKYTFKKPPGKRATVYVRTIKHSKIN